MRLTASKLRESIYEILDEILETGTPVEIERKGRILSPSYGVHEGGTRQHKDLAPEKGLGLHYKGRPSSMRRSRVGSFYSTQSRSIGRGSGRGSG